MILLILPLSLLVWSLVIWRDPEDSSTFVQSIANNALPLYAFSIIPGVLASALHTKLLIAAQSRSDIPLQLKSASLGTLLGVALAGFLSLLLFRTVSPELWPLWAWGAGMGLLYGGVRVGVER
jgi:hypothetical protein